MLLSVIMPAFNEESTIEEILKKVLDVDIEKEIIVVDDGSTDNTAQIVEKYPEVRLMRHDRNQGKGAAVKTGIQCANGEVIIIQDADLEYDPQDIIKCVEPILKKEASVVYGSRRLKKNKMSNLSFFLGGILITKIFNILYNTKLTDEPTCYKTFRTDLIQKIEIEGNGFEWEPEITAKISNLGIQIKEVPINYYPRTKKQGKKINWKDGLKAINTMIKWRF